MRHPRVLLIAPLASYLILCTYATAAPGNNGNQDNGNHYGRNGWLVKVSVSPSSSTLQVGQSLQFIALVSGTNNTSVNWLVNGTMGGNSTSGTISSSGLYTAPTAVTSYNITITAQSVVQSTASGSVQVSLSAAPPAAAVSVSVSPASASLQVGQSKQFGATVSGTSNTAVSWMVNGVQGGNSAVGIVSSSGSYTAPSSIPSSAITVTAQSVAQSTASASANVSITSPLRQVFTPHPPLCHLPRWW